MSYFIAFFIFVVIVIISIIINNIDTTIVHPVYLFNFLKTNIDDDFRTKSINKDRLLIDDDGLDTINYEELKKLWRKERITPFYIRISTKLNSYLYTIFKEGYVVLCKKDNRVYSEGDFIVVRSFGNYYLREVASDNSGNVSVYKPEGKNSTEDVNRMDIIGKITSYNKYRIGWV